MTSTLLNIAGKIDPKSVATIKAVSNAINELDILYVVVGATARDLVLHYGHGARIERATHDIDFAIQVPSWAAFDTLKETLCEQDFKTNKTHHRLISPSGTIIDILPFGGVADRKASLIWPPEGDVTMSVLGFQEACDTAQQVRIQDEPEFDIPVATPIGMVLLKFNVWDRITMGYVVDFIQVYYDRWYWPAFNIADSSISVGAVLLIVDGFRNRKNTDTIDAKDNEEVSNNK